MIHATTIESDLVQEGLAASSLILESFSTWGPLMAGMFAAGGLLYLVLQSARLGWARAAGPFLGALLVLSVLAPRPGTESKERTSLLISWAVEFTNLIAQGPLKALDDSLVTGFYDPATALPFRHVADEAASARLDGESENALRDFFKSDCLTLGVESPLSSFLGVDWNDVKNALEKEYARIGTEMKDCKTLYETAITDIAAWKGTKSNDAVYFAIRESFFKLAGEMVPRGQTVADVQSAAPPNSGICAWCLTVVSPDAWGQVTGTLVKWWIYLVPLHFLVVLLPGGILNLAYSFRGLLVFQLSPWAYYGLHQLDRYYVSHPPASFWSSDFLAVYRDSVIYPPAFLPDWIEMHNRALYTEMGATLVLGAVLAAAFVWLVAIPTVRLFGKGGSS